MFWRRKKTTEYLDDSRFQPASSLPGAAAPAAPGAGAPGPAGSAATGGAPALAVQDVFGIRGRGTVVTGVVTGGTLRTGQRVVVQRGGQVVLGAQIAGIEVSGKMTGSAEPGQNVGLLLRDVKRDQMQRGDQVVATG